ncbi:MAG: aminotransferase class I/II-fold pyridoxal phosphate-dependent enzyme [Planctomycetota bacterium]
MIRIPSDCGADVARRGFSHMASSMVGSSILKIANEIRALQERGTKVADLTVGDFAPSQFPIPDAMRGYLIEAIEEGCTNYPPSAGEHELRLAVKEHMMATQNLDYPIEGIAIVSGGRPSLFSTYALLVDPGDLVLFPVPSWNNHNYRDTCQVRVRGIQTRKEDAFQPTVDLLAPHARDARLLVLNTPQNPSGGVMPREEVKRFGEFLVEENDRRKQVGEKPLYLLYDQIYSLLTFPGYDHYSPVQLVPECAPYVIHADGISKGFCATGLRCGWLVGPPAVVRKVIALGTHVGAWAPRPVQVATARFLRNKEAMRAWRSDLIGRVRKSLDTMHQGIQQLKANGLPVDSIEPQGAIYLSIQLRLQGKTTPGGHVLANGEDIREYMLQDAAFGLIPFQAFGVEEEDEDGWFRASIGAVSVEEILASIPRVQKAVEALN